jgi:hypothetical protein
MEFVKGILKIRAMGEGQGARSKVKDRWIPDRVRDDREGVRGRLIGCGMTRGKELERSLPAVGTGIFPSVEMTRESWT